MSASALQANVRNYFMQFEEAQTQSLIDSKIMEFEMKSRQGLQVDFHHMLVPKLPTCFPPAICDAASSDAVCKYRVMRRILAKSAITLLVRPEQSCVSQQA